MPQTYHIPGRYHPFYSLLGRGMRRWIGDERRAENLFIVAVVLGGTGLVLLQFLVMAAIEFPAGGPPAWVWAGQLGVLGAFLLTSMIGYQPKIKVTYSGRRLEIEQAGRSTTINCSDIESAELVSDQTYYTHYGRYARTRAFVNHLPPQVLLLRTENHPIVLGLREQDRDDLLEVLCMTEFDMSSPASITS